jgi:hypothetical protein
MLEQIACDRKYLEKGRDDLDGDRNKFTIPTLNRPWIMYIDVCFITSHYAVLVNLSDANFWANGS